MTVQAAQPDAGSATKLALPASMSIREAVNTRELILAALQESGAILLDLPEDAQVDLSFIQIIEASRRHALSQGGSVALAQPARGSLLSTLERAGLLTEMAAEDQLFWLHRKEAA
ncbi:hypothetical protein BJF92_23290 [Rhizobium rhizosphaerae]|uniref:STAS domain-containing protein n=1 Tax=Xaviernesmea rhizosphaerae TaxID=1672749 RepID=A0A1Q9AJQ1_9HYPH|nr:STAS domain-containing protein [Xaviernesmea rhizosphaerae]OLP55467.1 hypothetical protein BJF92_23290 [Xaviernesmea rhizosphaerae]OQP85567.1 hypothetical protein BTR14_15390 [Xaviernesmea rhizosphaerae]